ncbi:transcriptional regulator EutR [Nitrincola nitratireducens]|uniref:Transcriptional regulator EutR n=1 Tax=Nitrincola nitratireducens TaxID=1229521 RepID=W9UYP8_9GAMM|nr:transcriptional regulator EutR [Nitrincola nitratireducens]
MHLLDLVDCEAVISLPTTARKLIVDRACEYALANPDAPPSIIDLCNRVGASRRKLQYCFQETLGINPVAYLRMLSLTPYIANYCNPIPTWQYRISPCIGGFGI